MEQAIDLTAAAPKRPGAVASAVGGIARAILATYRLGGRMFWVAPAIVAVTVLPELLQHAAEMKLGMFESRQAFRALAMDPTRWFFAYGKIAGLWLGILLTVRFLAKGGWRGMFRMPLADLARIVVAGGGTVLVDEALKLAGDTVGAAMAFGALSAFLQAGLTLYVVALVAGEEAIDLPGAFWRFLPTSALLVLLMAVAFVPAQALHTGNHLVAMGQPLPVVGLIMLFDSLLVGLMATLIGSAMVVAVRAGPTWRGWTRRPDTLA
ncbi:hypothetical protein [Sphingomonas humi]|uniref:Uncharacterized protein n=1 Tax=Sphingomonas humi TaxID=335630 RepID=A0ABP7RTV0_9SPHN